MESATLSETTKYDVGNVDLTGADADSSSNTTEPGWADFLAFPWMIKAATLTEPDVEEKRTWAQLARKARRRWQDENPY